MLMPIRIAFLYSCPANVFKPLPPTTPLRPQISKSSNHYHSEIGLPD